MMAFLRCFWLCGFLWLSLNAAYGDTDWLKQGEEDLAKGYGKSAISSFNMYLKKHPNDVRGILGLALALKKNGEADRAVPYFRKVLALDPDNVSALVTLGEILSWKENTRPEAIKLLDRAVTIAPNNFDVMFELGTIEGWSEKTREAAIEHLKKAEALKPQDSKTKKALGDLYQWTEHFAEAEKYYEDYLAANPNDLDVRHDLGKVLSYTHKNRERAIKEFDAILEKRPNDKGTRLDRAKTLNWMRRLDESIPELEKLVKEDNNPDATLALAEALNWSGKRAESEKYYRQYLAKRPNDFKARQDFAELLSVTPENRQEAIQLFNKLLDEQPNNDEVRFARAVSLAYIRDYPAAIKDLEPLVEKNPMKPIRKVSDAREELTPVLALAQIENWAGNFGKAARYYRQYLATEFGARDTAARRELAIILTYKPESYESALREIDQALRENPDDQQLLVARVRLLANMGKVAEAKRETSKIRDPEALLILGRAETYAEKTRNEGIEKLRQYVCLKPDNPDALLSLAQALSWVGKRKESLQIYEKLMAKNPEEMTYPAEHAMVKSWAGKIGAAKREYNKVLQRDPNNRAALIGLGQIYNWQGDHFKSEKIFAKASQKYPTDINVDIERALNYQQMGRLDKAYKLVDEALKRQN